MGLSHAKPQLFPQSDRRNQSSLACLDRRESAGGITTVVHQMMEGPTMISLCRRALVLLAVPAAAGAMFALPQAAQASPPHPAAAAAGHALTDGGGTDLSILMTAHNQFVDMQDVGSGSTFTKVSVGGGEFELMAAGLCLTVNTSDGDAVSAESCSGASSTLWFDQAESGGNLINSLLLSNEGITGHLTADPSLSCTTIRAILFAQGGLAAGNCHQEWNGA